MRAITEKAVEHFLASKPFKSGHDEVRVENGHVKMLLFNNIIAERINNETFICTCGYQTNTTKERLNGLPNVHIVQKNRVWYLNGEIWNGKPTKI